MKIGIVKLGKSTYWDPEKWKWIGADIEVRMLSLLLAGCGHHVHFWGRYQAKDPKVLPLTFHDTYDVNNLDGLTRDVDRSGVERLIVINGPISQQNAGGLMMMRRYTWPGIHLVNTVDTPWMYLYSDPRYFLKANELESAPTHVLAQTVGSFQHRHLETQHSYFDVSAFWRLGQTSNVLSQMRDRWKPLSQRQNRVVVIGHSKPGHQKLWNDCAKQLDAAGIPWEVWGIWPDAPKGDKRYTHKNMTVNAEELYDARYIVIIGTKAPIHEGYPFTGRWWEVASFGAIVLHNVDYDYTCSRLQSGFERGVDLVSRIQTLNSHHQYAQDMLDWQQSLYDESHADPSYLESQIMYYASQPTHRAFDANMLVPSVENIDLDEADSQVYDGLSVIAQSSMLKNRSTPALKIVSHMLSECVEVNYDIAVEALAKTMYSRTSEHFNPHIGIRRVFHRLIARGAELVNPCILMTSVTTNVSSESARIADAVSTSAKEPLTGSRSMSRGTVVKHKAVNNIIAHRTLDVLNDITASNSNASIAKLLQRRTAFEIDLRYDENGYYLGHDPRRYEGDYIVMTQQVAKSSVLGPTCWVNVKQANTPIVQLNLALPADQRARYVYFDMELVDGHERFYSEVRRHASNMPRFGVRWSETETPPLDIIRPCDWVWLDWFTNPWWWLENESVLAQRNVVIVGADLHIDCATNWREILEHQHVLAKQYGWKICTDYGVRP